MAAVDLQTTADVAIVGSGFAGSILALILQRQGRDVVVIDNAAHPRFAIGESSTPVANMVLTSLARQYDLPRLEPLAKYGTWQKTYPHLTCGLKRGFSYFKHHVDTPFRSRADHANELLVAANRNDRVSDTHWFRSDVDAFLAAEVRAAGIRLWEETTIDSLTLGTNGAWWLSGRRKQQPFDLTASFVVDASGAAGVLPRSLGIADTGNECRTNSRAVFGHFRNVGSWHDMLKAQGGLTDDHPFQCDHAAQHHILDEGWLWLLRFENGVTSAGLVLEGESRPADALPPAEEWKCHIERYPSLRDLFAAAILVDPPGGLVQTGCLQRRWKQLVGTNWAALPGTAGFIDPLHSTGIAHSLCGVERLGEILQLHWQRPTQATALDRYQQSVLSELDFADQLVAACYRGCTMFPLLTACSMLYFAAITTYEERRAAGDRSSDFLCANDLNLRGVVNQLTDRLPSIQHSTDVEGFADEIAVAIRPFNTVGLCDPTAKNMYRYTTAPEI